MAALAVCIAPAPTTAPRIHARMMASAWMVSAYAPMAGRGLPASFAAVKYGKLRTVPAAPPSLVPYLSFSLKQIGHNLVIVVVAEYDS